MKILFLSDIHGSMSALQNGLSAFEREGADYIVILGDLMYHGPRNPLPDDYRPADVAELINRYKHKIIAVRGNCDSEVDQMLIEYPMMDTSAFILDGKRRFFLTHGHVHTPEKLPPLNRGDVFAYGHTHIPVAEERSGIIIFNPGSASLPKNGHAPSYGVYDGEKLSVVSFDGDIICSVTPD